MQDFCCQKKLDIVDVIPLDDDGIFTNRRIVIGFCSNCKKIKYNLVEYNTIKLVNVYNRNKPKRIKNINQWIDSLIALKVPVGMSVKGNKSAMAFIFGKNKQIKNKIVQIGYDFNNTERYKRVINNDTSGR